MATFGNDLDVNGITTTKHLQITQGAAINRILSSDANGLASWVDPLTLNVDDGDWGIYGNDMYNMNTGNVGIGTASPVFNLHIKKSATLGLQNENVVVGGEIASISAGDANDPVKAKIVFESTGEYGEASEIAFYTSSEVTGTMYKALEILESKRLLCYGGANFQGNVSFNNGIHLNGTWIKGSVGNGGIFLGSGNKVGIGTNVPQAALDVAGTIKASSIEVGSMDVEEMNMAFLYVTNKIEAGEIEVKNMKAWEDEVFEDSYDLATLSEVEEFIGKNGHLPEIPSEAEVLENGYNMGEMDAMLLKKIEELTLYVIRQQKEIDELRQNQKLELNDR